MLPGDPAQMARRLIRVDDLPTAGTALDDLIRFYVRHLPGSDHGPLIARANARRWGLMSAPAWRATIRLAYLWDEAKARNGGRRIYATRPAVQRARDGVLIGRDGRPAADRVPVLGPDDLRRPADDLRRPATTDRRGGAR